MTYLTDFRRPIKQLAKKLYKYPENPAIPSKETTLTPRAVSTETTDRTGFKNRTNFDLVSTDLHRRAEYLTKGAKETTNVEGLVKFDDILPYGLTEEQEDELVKLEATRLIAVVDDDQVISFQGGGVLDTHKDRVFQNLSDVADQMICCLSICMHDNEVLMLDHCKSLYDVDILYGARRTLSERLDSSEPQRNPSKLMRDNTKVYNALVDYLTAVVARLCIRSLGLETFHTLCISGSSRLSTKLKILSLDSVGNGEKALQLGLDTVDKVNAKDRLHELEAMDIPTDFMNDWDELKYNKGGKVNKRAFKTVGDLDRMQYSAEMSHFRSLLNRILSFILANIKGSNKLTTSGTTASLDDFSVSTLVYGAGSSNHPTLLTLAISPIAKQHLFHIQAPKQKGTARAHERAGTDLVAKELSIETGRRMMQELDEKVRGQWVIDEDAIIIRCDMYVWTVLGLCLLLLIGGFTAAFTIGDRIPGVDPFGIATFCWLLAGFIVLVCKSVLVENWPWRDFLSRRCVCRSVTELNSVTSVEPQHIITYLLHNENSTILYVKGPFNTFFDRKSPSGSSGFAIDVKPTLRTLLLSGLIMVKVATVNGPALTSLSVRKGEQYVSLSHTYDSGPERLRLICYEIPREETQSGSRANDGLDLVFKPYQVEWYRIFGMYNKLDSTFR
ncbi:Fc.00g002260.m01.CDS01 [Cosmosporella sp. VM-42]